MLDSRTEGAPFFTLMRVRFIIIELRVLNAQNIFFEKIRKPCKGLGTVQEHLWGWAVVLEKCFLWTAFPLQKAGKRAYQ